VHLEDGTSETWMDGGAPSKRSQAPISVGSLRLAIPLACILPEMPQAWRALYDTRRFAQDDSKTHGRPRAPCGRQKMFPFS
jgi:hypothetical protein